MSTMELTEAKEIKDTILECTRRLDSSIAQLAKNEDERLVLAYKRLAGQVMGLMFTNILRPLYSTFPALAPEELSKDVPVPLPSLTPETVSLLDELVSQLREKLEVVGSKISSQDSYPPVVTEGNLQEVRESMSSLRRFIRQQGNV
jgi:hypothetical protein